MRIVTKLALATSAALLICTGALAQGKGGAAGQTVKIAFIDPQSGLMGPVGNNILRSYQYVAELANKEQWAKGIKFEIVPFDNKLSPQESLNALKAAIDQDIRYVAQGNGSSVALALVDAINKHNERNPGKEVLFLNYAAVDPDMTNSKCSFWHFRFDANSDMKMEALTSYMVKQKDIKNVYLINQDYAFGHQVRRAAKEYLERKRPDVKIVGDDLHPLAKVTDFSPYVAKMKASNTDTVITGNWGSDLALLIKAAKDAGLQANFYTYYASTIGVPTAMGASGVDRVRYVGYWNLNANPHDKAGVGEKIYLDFKKRFNEEYYVLSTYNVLRTLAAAITKAKTAEPVKVAFAMEGLKFSSINGEVEMRAADHQFQQSLWITSWQKAGGKDVKYDSENTGYGWRTEELLAPYVAAQPTSCQMKRPTKAD
jgi:branched-chain amino acid transport system substrate-binding protein